VALRGAPGGRAAPAAGGRRAAPGGAAGRSCATPHPGNDHRPTSCSSWTCRAPCRARAGCRSCSSC
jgi:hypothetical protein